MGAAREDPADAVFLLRDHTPHAEHGGSALAVQFIPGEVAFLDPEYSQGLSPIRNSIELLPRVHQLVDERIAISCRHGNLKGQLSGEGNPE